MPTNPFLCPSKKYRKQDQPPLTPPSKQSSQRDNPFLFHGIVNHTHTGHTNQFRTEINDSNSNSHSNSNSNSHSNSILQPMSFEDSFPSLSNQSSSNSNSAQPKAPPKLNFKSAIQTGQSNAPVNQNSQAAHHPHPHPQQPQTIPPFITSGPENMFLRPQPRPATNRYGSSRGYDEDEYANNAGIDADAYDSAYTKYYKD